MYLDLLVCVRQSYDIHHKFSFGFLTMKDSNHPQSDLSFSCSHTLKVFLYDKSRIWSETFSENAVNYSKDKGESYLLSCVPAYSNDMYCLSSRWQSVVYMPN